MLLYFDASSEVDYREVVSGEPGSARELECDVDYALPISWPARCIDCWLEASTGDGSNCRFSEAMTEIAGYTEDLHGARG